MVEIVGYFKSNVCEIIESFTLEFVGAALSGALVQTGPEHKRTPVQLGVGTNEQIVCKKKRKHEQADDSSIQLNKKKRVKKAKPLCILTRKEEFLLQYTKETFAKLGPD